MSKGGFLEKHGIVRNAIREDLLYFTFPAVVIFSLRMVVSTFNGRDGLMMILIGLVSQPRQVPLLSV